MSRTLSTNSGSVESLKVSLRCGCRQNAFQRRCTVEGAWPTAAAIERNDPAAAGLLGSTLHTARSQGFLNTVVTMAPQVTGYVVEHAAQLRPDRVVTVATPDYTVTPSGGSFGNRAQQSAAIAANNEILARAASARGIAFVDIFDVSLLAASDARLVAIDGLHPSAAQYALWVDRIEPVVRELLARRNPARGDGGSG